MSSRLSIGARVNHPVYGEGVISGSTATAWLIHFASKGNKEISKSFGGLEVVGEADEVEFKLNLNDLQFVLESTFRDLAGEKVEAKLASRYEGGTLVLKPHSADLQPKEVPIDVFFHKIVMVRDRLRVLEQNINSHEKLSDADKVHLQQYISRIYGSLTTFNVLFAEKVDHFSSKGQAED